MVYGIETKLSTAYLKEEAKTTPSYVTTITIYM
jgi:hypothetical protein